MKFVLDLAVGRQQEVDDMKFANEVAVGSQQQGAESVGVRVILGPRPAQEVLDLNGELEALARGDTGGRILDRNFGRVESRIVKTQPKWRRNFMKLDRRL